jgi:hypothetical protein
MRSNKVDQPMKIISLGFVQLSCATRLLQKNSTACRLVTARDKKGTAQVCSLGAMN